LETQNGTELGYADRSSWAASVIKRRLKGAREELRNSTVFFDPIISLLKKEPRKGEGWCPTKKSTERESNMLRGGRSQGIVALSMFRSGGDKSNSRN